MYDSANSNGILINEYGVLMKCAKTASNMKYAKVKWGGDKIYNEQAIVLDDFKEVFYTRYAKKLVSIVENNDASLLNTISSKIYIISTKKAF